MRRLLLGLLLVLVVGACAPQVQDVSLSATLEERRMGFDALCQHLTFEAMDRIVLPGQQPPAGHLHDHYGTLATPDATVSQMQQSTAACNRPEDTAGYWVTAVMKPDGPEDADSEPDPVPATAMKAYYRTDVPASKVKPIPLGLMIVAGNHAATATKPQSTNVVHWDCKNTVTGEVTGPWVEPHQCESPDAKPRLKIRFPQCWDGKRLDSPDHKAHTAYPKRVNGVYKCPSTHPVTITRLGLQFNYPAEGEPGWADMDTVTFSSGGRFSGHADFWNTWRVDGENGFNSLDTRCLNEGTYCGLGNQPR
jgi:Domain of unknown function (DUF1996)